MQDPSKYKDTSNSAIYEEAVNNGSIVNSDKAEEVVQYKNQFFKEVRFFGAGLGYKKYVHKNFSVGIKGSVGFQTNIWLKEPDDLGQNNPFFETYHYGIFVNYSKSDKLQYELGIMKTAYYYDDRRVEGTTSMSLGVFRKIKNVHLGLNLSFGKNTDKESLVYLSLLTLRMPLKKW